MKLSIILPALVASAKKRGNKKGDRNGDRNGDRKVGGDRFVSGDVTDECSSAIPNSGGSFDVFNNGRSGEITLDNYPDNVQCKHVVQADSSCEAIKITYQSIAVEPNYYDDCAYDNFRIGWTGTNELNVSPPVCNCFGDGCELDHDHELSDYLFFYQDDVEAHLGPTEYSVNSNTFTFFFKSDNRWSDGHVLLDWECVDDASAAPIEINTLISGSEDNCYGQISTFEELRDRVRSGIEQGLENDIDDFSKKPGQVTKQARKRIDQFKRWFHDLFENWYLDVHYSDNDYHKCMTSQFPYDSPGYTSKESANLGSDCALDLTSVDTICQNLKSFFYWATEDCQGRGRRAANVQDRCDKIQQWKTRIQSKRQA